MKNKFLNIFLTWREKNYSLSTNQIKKFENIIKYKFKNKELLIQALSHRSFVFSKKLTHNESNERLEFLGDSILNMCVAKFLYNRYPQKSEGYLTRVRALYISKAMIINACEYINLGEFVLLGKSELKTGGQKRKTILCDTYEAIVGAIFLDSNLEEAEKFIYRTLLNFVEEWQKKYDYKNYKSILLEYVQAKNLGKLTYKILEERGPDHNKVFRISANINDEIIGIGEGKSKKIAQQKAAKEAIKNLKQNIEK